MNDEDRKPRVLFSTNHAPTAIEKIKAKEAELRERVKYGLMSNADAETVRSEFTSLSIAHVVEHGPELKFD